MGTILQKGHHWEICSKCDGNGSHSQHLGAFTLDEFNDQFDDEGQERYFRGEYDTECEDCEGLGRVQVSDNPEEPEVDEEYDREWASEARLRRAEGWG